MLEIFERLTRVNLPKPDLSVAVTIQGLVVLSPAAANLVKSDRVVFLHDRGSCQIGIRDATEHQCRISFNVVRNGSRFPNRIRAMEFFHGIDWVPTEYRVYAAQWIPSSATLMFEYPANKEMAQKRPAGTDNK